MNGRRAARLEKLGMAWTAADARCQENLAAARVYYAKHWTLCAPRSATALDKPIGQWLSNLRRPGALAEHLEWEAALKEINEDWNPSWPPEWQRHYAALRELVRGKEEPPDQADRRQARRARRPRAGLGGHGRSGVMTAPEEERRVQEAVRRHARTRALAEAEKVISAVLSDPKVQEARARVEAAETELGRALPHPDRLPAPLHQLRQRPSQHAEVEQPDERALRQLTRAVRILRRNHMSPTSPGIGMQPTPPSSSAHQRTTPPENALRLSTMSPTPFTTNSHHLPRFSRISKSIASTELGCCNDH
jgi:hypothetical protein